MRIMRHNCFAQAIRLLAVLLLFSVPSAASPLKLSADGTSIDESGLIVTGVFSGCFYVETVNRSSGIRVEQSTPVVRRGQSVRVAGTMRTNSDGERYVEATQVTTQGFGSIAALKVNERTLGGGDWYYNPINGAGQQGTKSGFGMNNIGMLIKVIGTVTSSGTDYITVDDGSCLQGDTPGVTGVKVILPSGAEPLPNGTMVSVIGISSCYKSGGDIYSRIILIPSLF